MKKFNRWISLLLSAIMCVMLSACGTGLLPTPSSEATALAAPTNVQIKNETLTWNYVQYATGYTVKVVAGENQDIYNTVGTETPTAETSFSLAGLPDGKYTVGVRANGDSLLYSNSQYTVVQYDRKNDTGEEYKDQVTGAFGSFDEINTRESYLGYGIDIINATGVTSKNIKTTYPIFSKNALLSETLLKSNEHYSNLETIEAATIEEFKTKLSKSSSISAGSSVSASASIFGVHVGGGISLSSGLSSAFEQTTSETRSQYFLEIIAENQNYWLMLQTSEARYRELLSEEFKKDLYDEAVTPAMLFDKYGTHLLTSVAMGGNISMFYTLYSVREGVTTDQYYEVSSCLKTNADVSYGGFSAGTSSSLETHDSNAYQTVANKYGIRVEKKIVVSGGSGDFGIINESSLFNSYGSWQSSLDAYPVVVGIKDSNSLYPIWNLIDTSLPGAQERFNDLYAYFAEYGTNSYNALLETYNITPPVAPTDITNISLKTNSNYEEGEIVQIKAGDEFQITFDVLPENASKYKKTFSSSYPEYVTVDESGNVKVSADIPHAIDVKITITAGTIEKEISLRSIRTFNVSFNTGVMGLDVPSIIGIESSMMIEEPVISREGYTLDGWYRDADYTDQFIFDTHRVTSNLVLYAKWSAIKPVINYNSLGGSAVESETIKYNTVPTKPNNPTRDGYSFAGWFKDAELTDPYLFDARITANMTLFAKWTRNVYTVHFVTNGGTETSDKTTDVDKGYIISEPVTVKTYYSLEGWYRDNELTQRFYFTEKITSDITLYAKWDATQIPITFVDKNGSALITESGDTIGTLYTDVTKEFKLSHIPIPYKEGYLFLGWKWNGNDIDASTYIFNSTELDYKLVATWVDERYANPVKLTIKYVYENGTTAASAFIDSENYYYENTYSIVSPVIVGYAPDIAVVEGTMPAENITITVTYKVCPYNVTVNFSMEDNSSAPESIIYPCNYNETYNITIPDVTGYTPDIAVVTGIMPAENVSVSVIYRPNAYFIEYHPNGGEGEMENSSHTYNVRSELKSNKFTRPGYIFIGWNTTPDGSGAAYAEGAEVLNLSNELNSTVTLYARWGKLNFELKEENAVIKTEISWGGTTKTLTYGAHFTLEVPTAPYYVFEGWYSKDGIAITDNTGKSVAPFNLVTDTTLVAKWVQEYPDYIYISTPTEFKGIENDLSANYLLCNNITLTDTEWIPFGGFYSETAYTGTLDGKGHYVSGLRRTANIEERGNRSFFGLFGWVGKDGKVVDLELTNVYVNINGPANNNASMAAFFGAVAGKCEGEISSVTVSGEFTYTCCTNGSSWVGGICGYAIYSTIDDCVNKMKISSDRYAACAAGIAALSEGGSITNCINEGNITAIGTDWGGFAYAGGIIGVIHKTNSTVHSSNENKDFVTLTAREYSYIIGGCSKKTGDIYALIADKSYR